jgi:hypothetical protein
MTEHDIPGNQSQRKDNSYVCGSSSGSFGLSEGGRAISPLASNLTIDSSEDLTALDKYCCC